MNINYVIPVILLMLSNVIFWYKGNSKVVFGFDWSPFKWWLYTSLATNYMTLYSWWKLIEISDVWKAGVIWGLTSLIVDITLNCYYFGYNWKGIAALCLCGIAALIVHS